MLGAGRGRCPRTQASAGAESDAHEALALEQRQVDGAFLGVQGFLRAAQHQQHTAAFAQVVQATLARGHCGAVSHGPLAVERHQHVPGQCEQAQVHTREEGREARRIRRKVDEGADRQDAVRVIPKHVSPRRVQLRRLHELHREEIPQPGIHGRRESLQRRPAAGAIAGPR